MELRKVALLNPLVPHYREEFYHKLQQRVRLDIYVYEKQKNENRNFQISDLKVQQLGMKGLLGDRFVMYNFFPLLRGRYDTLVLMLHFGHLSTWLLLMTRFLHRKRIILWGQGISVKRYLHERKHPSRLFKWMIGLADGLWLYTEEEKKLWQGVFPNKSIVALNNTISGVEDILNTNFDSLEKALLREKYGIKQATCFIYCARFDNPHRRVDLLLRAMEKLDKAQYGFIIIGDGLHKPDFSRFEHVYDFGKVYDKKKKDELFAMADLYFQPGWIGLSVVEAMAYSKPIITFRRSEEVLQCVEYAYIQEGYNSLIVDDINDLVSKLAVLGGGDIREMGERSKDLVAGKLRMEHMVENALSIL